MASLTQWTWVWARFSSSWWTGKLGVLQSMRSQRVRHDWATELNWAPTPDFFPTISIKEGTGISVFNKLLWGVFYLKDYSWVVLSIVTKLCNHPQHPIPERFHFPKLKLCPVYTNFPLSPCLQQPPVYFFTILDISCKWDHKMFVLLCHADFT